jgi:hypothetical protein
MVRSGLGEPTERENDMLHRTAACLLLSVAFVWAGIPIHEGERILFVGNSYTGFTGGLHNHVKTICTMGDAPIDIDTHLEWAGGTELIDLYDVTNAVGEIRTGNYDIVVLQADNNPFIDPATFFEAVRKFDVEIRAVGAQTVLYMVWTYPTQELGSYLYCLNNHTQIAAEVGAFIVPVGVAWWGLRKRPPLGQGEFFLYVDDGADCHQNEIGTTLNTYIFYAALTGNSPVGIDFGYGGFDGASELADTLKQRAWTTVSGFNQVGVQAAGGRPAVGREIVVRAGHAGLQVSTPTAAACGAGLFAVNGASLGSHRVEGRAALAAPAAPGLYILRADNRFSHRTLSGLAR